MTVRGHNLDRLRGKRLLIFDDGLATRDGHWLDQDKAVAAIHADLGVATTVVCDKDFAWAAELEEAGITVLPLVAHSPWRDIAAGRSPHRLLRCLAIGWHFRGLLKRLLREGESEGGGENEGGGYDCVFHPAAMGPHLMAWCLLPRRYRRRAGRIMFATWVTLASYDAAGQPRFPRHLLFWKAMGVWLRSAFASGRMAFGTDSERLAREYRLLGSIPATPIPSPGIELNAVAERAPDAPICFGSLGPARLEKGIDVLQQAIQQVLDAEPGDHLRFVIQWNRAVTDRSGAEIPPSPRLLADPRVRFITEAMTSEDYRDLLVQIDCLVLPYRRSAYFSRGSGVAVEAACAAIPMIYTADTWLSDYVEREGAGLAVPDGDSPALAGAMRDMAATYPAWREKAVAQSMIARDSNSAEGFALALWGNPT